MATNIEILKAVTDVDKRMVALEITLANNCEMSKKMYKIFIEGGNGDKIPLAEQIRVNTKWIASQEADKSKKWQLGIVGVGWFLTILGLGVAIIKLFA
jgi:hypothetical protein